jgi:signal transduction histidine kinase
MKAQRKALLRRLASRTRRGDPPDEPPLSVRLPQTVVVLASDHRVIETGDRVDRVLGGASDDVIGLRLARIPWAGGHGRFEIVWADRSVHALEFTATTGSHSNGQFVALREIARDAGGRALPRDPKHALMADLRVPDHDPLALIDGLGVRLAAALDADRVGVFESSGPARPLVLRAGTGWGRGAIGHATAAGAPDALVGRALASSDPVIIRDLRRAGGREPPLSGVISGVEVAICPHRRPWGVLGAYSTRPRRFSPDEVDFLSSVADVLGVAIDRARAETRTRAEIAQRLHDDALQSMLAARQHLAARTAEDPRGERETPARQAVERAIRELRAVVRDVHPVVAVPLRAAIEAAVAERASRAGFETTLEIEPEAGEEWAPLLLSLARELIANVAEHAQARHVRVELRRHGDGVVLEVADDGRGMEPERVEQALSEGRIGLASAASRIAAIGGELTVASAPGQGTRVRLELRGDGAPGSAVGEAGTGAG